MTAGRGQHGRGIRVPIGVALWPVLVLTLFLSASGARQNDNGMGFVFPDQALPTSSGYLSINDSTRARMFYAFYEASDPEDTIANVPLILWLQGGPGCSGMIGSFYELGPWRTAPDLLLHENEGPWNRRFGVLFFDSPVGVGYSIAENDEDIPVNQAGVAADLYVALQRFYELNPSFRVRPFFVAGESYGGKYVPALGQFIVSQWGLLQKGDTMPSERESRAHDTLRLDGIMIGNGLTHPIVQVRTHADTAYEFGLIDKNQKEYVDKLAKAVVALIEDEDWYGAYLGRTAIMDFIINASDIATVLDVRRSVPYHHAEDGTEFLSLFLNKQSVKEALKAERGAEWVPCNPRVRKRLLNDTMKSVKWMVEELLEKVPVLLYQGQFDAKDGVAGSEEWMQTLSWDGIDKFFSSRRLVWRVGQLTAGRWRSYGHLTHVTVFGAGHEVPADQNLHSQNMVEKWITQQLHCAKEDNSLRK